MNAFRRSNDGRAGHWLLCCSLPVAACTEPTVVAECAEVGITRIYNDVGPNGQCTADGWLAPYNTCGYRKFDIMGGEWCPRSCLFSGGYVEGSTNFYDAGPVSKGERLDVDLAANTIVWTLPYDGKIWKLKYKITSTTQP